MADGAAFLSEVREQPAALARLFEHAADVCAIGARIAERSPHLIRLVAHGSSDNAASYGVYAFGIADGRTAVRDSISLTTYYGAKIDFAHSVVIALSQSGRTPDVVEYAERARAAGALTVAVTNDPQSELARACDLIAALRAGDEAAVAATKTYTNQLAALALLAAGAAGRGAELRDAAARVPELLAAAVEASEQQAPPVASAFAFTGRMFVIGRGIEFATARELALKLTETCGIAAEPLTATDLVHGPIAAVNPLFPVWAVASEDAAFPAVHEAAARAAAAGATLIASGPAADRIADASFRLPLPAAPDPMLAPLLSIVPGQVFAWALAQAKGLDPDRPTHLTKVTLAK